MHFHKNLYKELLYCKDFSTDEISKLNGRKCVKTIKIILTLLDCPSTNKKSHSGANLNLQRVAVIR